MNEILLHLRALHTIDVELDENLTAKSNIEEALRVEVIRHETLKKKYDAVTSMRDSVLAKVSEARKELADLQSKMYVLRKDKNKNVEFVLANKRLQKLLPEVDKLEARLVDLEKNLSELTPVSEDELTTLREETDLKIEELNQRIENSRAKRSDFLSKTSIPSTILREYDWVFSKLKKAVAAIDKIQLDTKNQWFCRGCGMHIQHQLYNQVAQGSIEQCLSCRKFIYIE